jgi:hypothetical protein
VGALAALSLTATLGATTVLPADLATLTRDARAIVRGLVVAVETSWAPDHRSIETVVTLDTRAYLKGALGSAVQFRVPGGRLGRFQSIMLGAPRFEIGQHVIVFLGATGPSVPYVVGLNQGVYRLAEGAGGWLVTPPPVIAGRRGGPIVRGDRSRTPLPLAEFELRVRQLAGEAQ